MRQTTTSLYINNQYVAAYMSELNLGAKRMAGICRCSISAIQGYIGAPGGNKRNRMVDGDRMKSIDSLLVAQKIVSTEGLAAIKRSVDAVPMRACDMSPHQIEMSSPYILGKERFKEDGELLPAPMSIASAAYCLYSCGYNDAMIENHNLPMQV